MSSGPPTVRISNHSLSKLINGNINVTVSWTPSGGDSADFYLINIITNSSQTPYGGLLNITAGSVTQHKLTGFMAGYMYNITVRGVNCVSQEGKESELLPITPQGMYTYMMQTSFPVPTALSDTHPLDTNINFALLLSHV